MKLTCSTRFGRPVFCDSCLRSFASGLWLIAKYDFMVRSWWCLKDVRIRLARDDDPRPRLKPKSRYSVFKSAIREDGPRLIVAHEECPQVCEKGHPGGDRLPGRGCCCQRAVMNFWKSHKT